MKTDKKIVTELLSEKAAKKYAGKEVVIVAGKVHILPDNDGEAKKLLNRLIAEHPKEQPTITFVPRQGTYILSLHK